MEFSVDENRAKQSIRQEREREILGSRKVNLKGWISSCAVDFHLFCLSVCVHMSENSKGSDTHIKDGECVWGQPREKHCDFLCPLNPLQTTCQWLHAAQSGLMPCQLWRWENTHTHIHTVNHELTHTLLNPQYKRLQLLPRSA